MVGRATFDSKTKWFWHIFLSRPPPASHSHPGHPDASRCPLRCLKNSCLGFRAGLMYSNPNSFSCRVSGALSTTGPTVLLGLRRVGAISKMCAGCGDRDTCSRLACTKWSVAPLLTVKLDGFGTFSFQDLLQPPIATLATQMPPDAPSHALKIAVWVLSRAGVIYTHHPAWFQSLLAFRLEITQTDLSVGFLAVFL